MMLLYNILVEEPDNPAMKWLVEVVVEHNGEECHAVSFDIVKGLKPVPQWVLDYAGGQVLKKAQKVDVAAEEYAEKIDRAYDEERDRRMGL